MNYKVASEASQKNSNIINLIQRKHIIYEKIWIYCIYCKNINMGVIVYCISKLLYSIRSVLLYHIVYFFATYCTYCIFWPRCMYGTDFKKS